MAISALVIALPTCASDLVAVVTERFAQVQRWSRRSRGMPRGSKVVRGELCDGGRRYRNDRVRFNRLARMASGLRDVAMFPEFEDSCGSPGRGSPRQPLASHVRASRCRQSNGDMRFKEAVATVRATLNARLQGSKRRCARSTSRYAKPTARSVCESEYGFWVDSAVSTSPSEKGDRLVAAPQRGPAPWPMAARACPWLSVVCSSDGGPPSAQRSGWPMGM